MSRDLNDTDILDILEKSIRELCRNEAHIADRARSVVTIRNIVAIIIQQRDEARELLDAANAELAAYEQAANDVEERRLQGMHLEERLSQDRFLLDQEMGYE